MTITHKAYLKPLLHAAKYPTTAVNGVLLAEQGSAKVVDAVPFFHFWNSLTPMLEVAMTQVYLVRLAQNHLTLGRFNTCARGATKTLGFGTLEGSISSSSLDFCVIEHHGVNNHRGVLFCIFSCSDQSTALAFSQVDLYSKANGLRIIGYYEANEQMDHEALSLVGQKIADQILKVEPEAFALVVSCDATLLYRLATT